MGKQDFPGGEGHFPSGKQDFPSGEGQFPDPNRRFPDGEGYLSDGKKDWVFVWVWGVVKFR